MTNVTSIKKEKMRIGISTSVLFDMSEPDAVWRAEQKGDVPRGSYHRYMMDNIDTPLRPHADMYDIIRAHIESDQYELALMSRNSVLTGMRAIKTMVQKGIVPDQFVFTNGASVAEYCLHYGIDRFFTSNENDAEKAHILGIAPAIYSHPTNTDAINVPALIQPSEVGKLFTGPRVMQGSQRASAPEVTREFSVSAAVINYAFDFDKVLAGPESDDFFAASGFDITQYRKHELDRLHVEMQKAPWFTQYEKMMREGRAFHKAHINTARGAEAAFRMFFTLAKWGIEPNGEVHCMSGMDKTPVLLELKRRYGDVLFLDDGQKNVDRARKSGISTGHVPSKDPKAYLGS